MLQEDPQQQQMDNNNMYETVFLTGSHPPPKLKKANSNNMLSLSSNMTMNRAPMALVAAAPSKQLYQSNMAQQPFYSPYRDKIVVQDQPIMTEPNCVASESVPHTSLYDSGTTVNYNTSPPYSSAYLDSNCCYPQSSPVAEVPSSAAPSSFDLSSTFEPIYYSSDPSFFPEYLTTTAGASTSEKSVDDWLQYLHSDEEGGASFEEPLGVADCDLLFPEFGEEDMTLLDNILTETTFEHEQPCQPQQDMPAGSSASPQYQYDVIQYIPIAPKPADYQEQQPSQPSPSSSANSSNANPRKRQRLDFQNAEEEYRLKRNLNNIASAKSRQKKRDQQDFMKQEKVRLESRNRQLKNEVEEFERQIATLKEILYSKIKK